MTEEKNLKIKHTEELINIQSINESVLQGLKAQKARGDQLLDKYKDKIQVEMDRPANTFLDWTRSVEPFMDAMISSKVIELEMKKRYEAYITELIKHDERFMITQDQIQRLEGSYSRVLDIVLKLEEKILNLKNSLQKIMMDKQVIAIEYYQDKIQDTEHITGCLFCGVELTEENSKSDDECLNCAIIPEDLKPDLKWKSTETFKEVKKEPNENQDSKEPNENQDSKEPNENQDSKEVAEKLFGKDEQKKEAEEKQETIQNKKRGRPPGKDTMTKKEKKKAAIDLIDSKYKGMDEEVLNNMTDDELDAFLKEE